MLHTDADTNSVSMSLEAYLVWLFGYVMFSNTHKNSVDKFLYTEGALSRRGQGPCTSVQLGISCSGSHLSCMLTLTDCPLLLQLTRGFTSIELAWITSCMKSSYRVRVRLTLDRPTMDTL
jgi:hypothetical protein